MAPPSASVSFTSRYIYSYRYLCRDKTRVRQNGYSAIPAAARSADQLRLFPFPRIPGAGERGGEERLKGDLSCFSGANSHFPSPNHLLVLFRFCASHPHPPFFLTSPLVSTPQPLQICNPRQWQTRRRDIRLHHRIVLPSRPLFSRPFTSLVARWLFNGLRNGANVACLRRRRGRKIRSYARNKIRELNGNDYCYYRQR